MKPIEINVPQGSEVIGELLNNYEECPDRLNQDILQVTLPSGVVIDVGWYPRFDPAGKFSIAVFAGDWENQIREPIESDDPYEVAEAVADLSQQYMNRIVFMQTPTTSSPQIFRINIGSLMNGRLAPA